MLGFCPWFLAQSFKSPRNFLSEEFLCYANEVTQAGLLDSFWMPTGHQKEQHVIKGFRLSTARLLGKEGAGDWAQSFNQLCFHNETAIKTLDTKFSRASLLMNTFTCLENIVVPGRWHAMTPHRPGTGVLCSKPSQTPPYVILYEK